MNHFRLIGKCVATAMLGIAFVVISGLVIAMTPVYMALSMKGNFKLGSLVFVIPMGILGLLWRLWRPEPLSETEKAYSEGIKLGKLKAARKLGEIDGGKMISRPKPESRRIV